MAGAGRAVSSKFDRLNRLALAQGKLVKALEMEVQRAEQRSLALAAAGKQLDEMAVKAGTEQPSLMPSLLRCLADAETDARRARADVATLQQRLLSAKFREDAISSRAKMQREAHVRKAAEEDVLETVLLMGAKASGKRDVLI